MDFNTISVVGLGYIGLPTAAMFASRKKKVIGVDVNPVAVETINQGKIHIIEPELDMVVHAAVTEGYLQATTEPKPADAFLIAVPTPFKNNHEPDLSYIEAASKAIAPVLQKGNLVILESTSPVGATEKMAGWLAEARPDLSFPADAGDGSDIRIAHCPERVLPGHVMRELIENDRIIGGLTPKCAEASVALYKTFVEGECVVTDARTAEMCKLTENSFRDVNIAFANELSIICEKQGINVWELIKLSNRHPRVNILQPGAGVGGHCIAVDPWFLVHSNPDEAKIIRTAREVNDNKPEWIIDKVEAAVSKVIDSGKKENEIKISVLGLAFKADIDDLRESPALGIAVKLGEKYPSGLLVVEPNIEELPEVLKEEQKVQLEYAVDTADVCVLLVAHSDFRSLNSDTIRGIVVDATGITS